MIMKKGHRYINKNPKGSLYVNEIMPFEDREVPKKMFDCFEDTTKEFKEADYE